MQISIDTKNDGDATWTCIKCSGNNFLSRNRCFRCTAGRPTIEEQRLHLLEVEKSNKNGNGNGNSNSGRGGGRVRGRGR